MLGTIGKYKLILCKINNNTLGPNLKHEFLASGSAVMYNPRENNDSMDNFKCLNQSYGLP